MTIANVPIVNAGLIYVNGLILSADVMAFPKSVTLSSGAARDTNNINDIITLDQDTVINGAVVGPNGVDTLPIIANAFYGVYVIGDSTKNQPTAGLLSPATFFSASIPPFLPVGYDMFRRVGWVLTDSSANILQFWQYGTDQTRSYWYDVPINALTAGNSTTPSILSLATSVPPIDTEVTFQVTFSANLATDIARFLTVGANTPSSIIATFGYGISSSVSGAPQQGMLIVPSHIDPSNGQSSILWEVSAGGDSLSLKTIGYKDYL